MLFSYFRRVLSVSPDRGYYHLIGLWYCLVLIGLVTAWRYLADYLNLRESSNIELKELSVFIATVILLNLLVIVLSSSQHYEFLLFAPAIGFAFAAIVALIILEYPHRFVVFGSYSHTAILYIGIAYSFYFKKLKNQVSELVNNPLKKPTESTLKVFIDECKFWMERGFFVGAAFLSLFGVLVTIMWISQMLPNEGEKVINTVSATFHIGFGIYAIALWVGRPLLDITDIVRKHLSEKS